MKGIISEYEEGRFFMRLSKEIYEKDAIMQAAYKLTDLCTIMIKPHGESEVEVVFEPQGKTDPAALRRIAARFCNEVLDQQVRLDLDKRYGKLRELIVQHAFSPLGNLEEHIKKQ